MRRHWSQDVLLWGQSRTLTPLASANAPRIEQLLRVNDLQSYSEDPLGFAVTIGWVPSNPLWVGIFNVVAEVVWHIGGGEGTVQIDVPAGGTSIAIGAADTVEVRAWVETGIGPIPIGAPAITARASAMLSLSTASQPRAVTRTQFWTFPADSGVPRVIPSFARGVRVQVSDPAIIPALSLRMKPDITPGIVLFTAPINAGALIPICGAAWGYDMLCAVAGSAAAIWEIQV